MLQNETSLKRAEVVNTIGDHNCEQKVVNNRNKDVNNKNKEMLTIISDPKMLAAKSHLCYPQ